MTKSYDSEDLEEVLDFTLRPEFHGGDPTGRKCCPFPGCSFSSGDMADMRLHVEAEARKHRAGLFEWFRENKADIELAVRGER